MVFLTPRSQYEVYDHEIWGEATSDRYLQTPNNDLSRDFVYTHQESTKVAKLVKNSHNVENAKNSSNSSQIHFFIEKVDFFKTEE